MLVFLTYMIILDKYLPRQLWVLHPHTLFMFPLLFSNCCYPGRVAKGGPCRYCHFFCHCCFTVQEKSQSEKAHWESSGISSKRYSTCSRWQNFLLILVPDYLWNACQKETGLSALFPFIPFFSQRSLCNLGWEETSRNGVNSFPFVIWACFGCSLQEALWAALVSQMRMNPGWIKARKQFVPI